MNFRGVGLRSLILNLKMLKKYVKNKDSPVKDYRFVCLNTGLDKKVFEQRFVKIPEKIFQHDEKRVFDFFENSIYRIHIENGKQGIARIKNNFYVRDFVYSIPNKDHSKAIMIKNFMKVDIVKEAYEISKEIPHILEQNKLSVGERRIINKIVLENLVYNFDYAGFCPEMELSDNECFNLVGSEKFLNELEINGFNLKKGFDIIPGQKMISIEIKKDSENYFKHYKKHTNL